MWAAQAVDTTVLVCILKSQVGANLAPQLVWPLFVMRCSSRVVFVDARRRGKADQPLVAMCTLDRHRG